MKFCFEKNGTIDEYVRILWNDNHITVLAISSTSKHYPGLWMNRDIHDMKIIGVDLI